MRHFIAGASMFAATASLSAFAKDAVQAEEPTELEEIVVVDGLTSVKLTKSARAVTVVSGQEMESNQIRYVGDALRLVPGVAVSRTGAYGGLTQVRMRGAEGNHVLVMIDGVAAMTLARANSTSGA